MFDDYGKLRSQFKSDDEMVNAAFSSDELAIYDKAFDLIIGTDGPSSKRAFRKSKMRGELPICAYIKLNGKLPSYIAENYNDADKTLEKSDGDLANVMKELIDKKLPLSESLVTEYKFNIKNKVLDDKLQKLAVKYRVNLENVKDNKIEFIGFLRNIIRDSNDTTVVENCFIIICKLIEAYDVVTGHGKYETSLMETIANKLYKETLVVNGVNGERLATKHEVKKMPAGVIKKKELLVSEEAEKNIYIATWAITNNNNYYKRAKLVDCKRTEDMIESNIDEIIKALTYIVSSEFLGDDQKRIIDGNKPIDYLDSAEDELDEDVKIVEMLKLVKKELDPDYGDWYSRLAWKIASDCIKKKKYELSEKQYKIIEDNYNKIVNNKKITGDKDASKFKTTSNAVQVADDYNKYSDELLKKSVEVKKFITGKKGYNNNTFYKMVLDICSKIKKNKICSEKQASIIEKIYSSDVVNAKSKLEEAMNKVGVIDNSDIESDMNDMFGVEENNKTPELFENIGSIFTSNEVTI